MKVAIQGIKGCFHEQAAYLFYEKEGMPKPEIVECSSFVGLYEKMDGGAADAAIMAIENTVSGGLLPNFELLRKYDRKIKGEVFLRIKQNLMTLPGQKIEDLHEVIQRFKDYCVAEFKTLYRKRNCQMSLAHTGRSKETDIKCLFNPSHITKAK